MKKSIINIVIIILIIACLGIFIYLLLNNREKSIEGIENISIVANKKELNVGDDTKLNIIIKTDDIKNYEVNWSSSNPSVATISDTGVVRAISSGETTITAKVEDKESSVTIIVTGTSIITPLPITPTPAEPVIVTPVAPTPTISVTPSPAPTSSGVTSLKNLTISSANLTVAKGATVNLSISLKNAVGRVDVTSSNSNIASVSEDKIWLESLDNTTPDKKTITVRGVNTGTTTITVNLKDVASFDTIIPITGSLKVNVTVK